MADKWRGPRRDSSSETGASNHARRLVLFFCCRIEFVPVEIAILTIDTMRFDAT